MEEIKQSIKLKTIKLNLVGEGNAIDQEVLEKFGLKNVQLRPHQIEGINWLIARYKVKMSCILADEMGLGKTCQAISFLTYVYGSSQDNKPSLILLPLSIIHSWKNELSNFSPSLSYVVYVGNKEERKNMRNSGIDNGVKLIITTYEICLRDESYLVSFNWKVVIVDEAHRLKNYKSLLYAELFKFQVDHWLLLTGTPVQNDLRELYSLLSLCQRDVFQPNLSGYFLDHYADVTSSSGADIKSVLENFILRRLKSQVLHDLPGKSEVILYHGLSALQSKYYRAILTKDLGVFNYDDNHNPAKKRNSLMHVLMQLRKCVCHPYLFDGVEPEPFLLGEHLVEASGKLLLLDRLLGHLCSTGHRVLLFSQFTSHLDIVQDYMTLRKYSYERLDGSMRSQERNLAIENFNSSESTFAFLLSTRAGGLGLNLTSADTVVFLDGDFNPQNDIQAAARTHRIGQKRNVKIIKLVGRHTVEEVILRKADDKLRLSLAVMSSSSKGGKEEHLKLEDIIKFGLEKLFSEDRECEVDFEAILGRSVNGEWDLEGGLTEATSKVECLVVKNGEEENDAPSAGDEMIFQRIIDEKSPKGPSTACDHPDLDAPRITRGKKGSASWMLLDEDEQKKKKRKHRLPLTTEQREVMKKKRQERMEKLAKEREEKKLLREQQRSKRRLKLWQDNNYSSNKLSSCEEEEEEDDDDDGRSEALSSGITDDSDSNCSEGEDDDDDDPSKRLHFVVGDVSRPSDVVTATTRRRKKRGRGPLLIVHCVDDSGHWGRGGVFSALGMRFPVVPEQYELAGRMGDLDLGDVHIIHPIKSTGNEQQVALLVVQSRSRKNKLMDINVDWLQKSFEKLSRYAKSINGSLHFPRIGQTSSTLDCCCWYAVERSIRKHFVSRGIHAYIYYFPRGGLKRKLDYGNDDDDDCRGSTSQCRSNELKICTNKSQRKSLPDFLKGISISFVERGEDPSTSEDGIDGSGGLARILTRYIVAYDGDVIDAASANATHLVADREIHKTKVC